MAQVKNKNNHRCPLKGLFDSLSELSLKESPDNIVVSVISAVGEGGER